MLPISTDGSAPNQVMSSPLLKSHYAGSHQPVRGLHKPLSLGPEYKASHLFTTSSQDSAAEVGSPSALCPAKHWCSVSMHLVFTAAVTHLIFHTFHCGPAEGCDVNSHCLPILTKDTELKLYCLSLLQTVTFVCHSNNSKWIDLSLHLA